jgi:uncharacterized protein
MISKELLDLLACPVCKAPLRPKQESLQCVSCRRVFPIQDGIPILLEEAGKIENG